MSLSTLHQVLFVFSNQNLHKAKVIKMFTIRAESWKYKFIGICAPKFLLVFFEVNKSNDNKNILL